MTACNNGYCEYRIQSGSSINCSYGGWCQFQRPLGPTPEKTKETLTNNNKTYEYSYEVEEC